MTGAVYSGACVVHPVTRVKICGLTCVVDALQAAGAGADAIGMVFADSPRCVGVIDARAIVQAMPPFVTCVGVFMDQGTADIESIVAATGIQMAQLHGDETPDECSRISVPVIKRHRVLVEDTRVTLDARMAAYTSACNVSAQMLDPGGGSGVIFDWSLAAGMAGPIVLAGGLTSVNVGDAIRIARPCAVDVSSGVEVSPGRKDHEKVSLFIRHAKGCS